MKALIFVLALAVVAQLIHAKELGIFQQPIEGTAVIGQDLDSPFIKAASLIRKARQITTTTATLLTTKV